MSTNPDETLPFAPVAGKRGRGEEATGGNEPAPAPEEQIRKQIRELQAQLEQLELQKSQSVKVFEEKILEDCNNIIKREETHECVSKGLLPRFDLGYRWNKPPRKSANTAPLSFIMWGAAQIIEAEYAQWRESAISSFGRNPVFISFYTDSEEKYWIVFGKASLDEEKVFRVVEAVRVEHDTLKCPGKNKLKTIDYPGGIGSVIIKFGCGTENFTEIPPSSVFWFGDTDSVTDIVFYAPFFSEAASVDPIKEKGVMYLKSFSKYAHLFSVNPTMLVEYEFRITRHQPSVSSPSNEVVEEKDIKDSGALWPEDHAYIENRALPASNSSGYKDYYMTELRDYYTYASEGGSDHGEKLDKEMWFDTASTREKVRAVFSDAVDSAGNPDETRVYAGNKKQTYEKVQWILSHLQLDTTTRTINSFVSFSSIFFGSRRDVDLFCLLRMIYYAEKLKTAADEVTYTVYCTKSNIDYWLSLGFSNPTDATVIATVHKGRYVLQCKFGPFPVQNDFYFDEQYRADYRTMKTPTTYDEVIRKQQ
jgi:hypothetical protein